MKHTPWRRALYVMGLVGGLAFFLRQVWLGWQAIELYNVRVLQPVYLVLAMLCCLALYALHMFAWTLLLRHLGSPIRLRQTFEGFMISFLPRYIPGSVWGYWSRSEWLDRTCGLSYRSSLFASALEVLGLVLTGLMWVAAYELQQGSGLVSIALGGGGVLLGGAALLLLPRLTTLLGGRFLRVQSGEPARRPAAAWVGVAAGYLGIWLAYGASTLLVGSAILPVSPGNLLAFTAASGVSWLTGLAIVIVPAGLGIREFTLALLLRSFLGVPDWQGNLVALGSRLLLVLAELFWLAVGLGSHLSRRHQALTSAKGIGHSRE